VVAEGFYQADIARELGVTRQAIQKMPAIAAVSGVGVPTLRVGQPIWSMP
jgi:hypothetical protein